MSIVTVPNLSNPATSFTPSLTFGGGATGMVYVTRNGWYVKIGSFVFFAINITLSTKGSSTGGAVVSGLPFTASVSGYVPVSIYADVLSSVTSQIDALVNPNTQLMTLYQLGSGTAASLTHSNFNNTSSVFLSGCYSV